MRFGSKIICLVRDPVGFGPALFDALRPLPNSTREVSSFNIPSLGEKYGIVVDEPVTVEIARFFAPDGSLQVSLLMLANLQPPTAVCAINELLMLLLSDNSDDPPVVILPYHVAPEKIKYRFVSPSDGQKAAIFGIQVCSTNASHAMLDGVPNPPSTLQIHCEPLSCLVHLIQVYKMPAILLVGTGCQHGKNAADQAYEALLELGQFMANRVGLTFDREIACLKNTGEPGPVAQEPWRALYG